MHLHADPLMRSGAAVAPAGQAADASIATAWFSLAVLALAAASGLAIAMLLLKWPAGAAVLPAAGDAFRRLLVLHVDLALYVWIPAFGAALWVVLNPVRNRPLAWAAFGLAAGGTLAILLSALTTDGSAILSNYLPVIDHSGYFAGLVWIGAGVGIAALQAVAGGRGAAVRTDAATTARASAVAVLAALAVVLWSMGSAPQALSRNAGFEIVFWGFGHVAQFASLGLLLTAWMMQEGAEGVSWLSWRGRLVACAILAPLASVPWILSTEPMATLGYRNAFTLLMVWGGAIALAAFFAISLRRVGRTRATSPKFAVEGLRLSTMLVVSGVALGAAIRGETTTVPAHYHAMLGGMTLAFMVAGYRLLPLLGARVPAGALLVVRAFGGGAIALVVGLALFGAQDMPRKAASFAVAADPLTLGATAAMAAGGVLALCAIWAFAFQVLRALAFREVAACGIGAVRARREARPVRRDVRRRVLVWTAASIAGGGLALGLTTPDGGLRNLAPALVVQKVEARVDPAGHVRQMQTAEFDLRFRQAAVMLHAREYEHALTALHRLLEIRPDVPELHVNMGYALIGLRRFGAARDFFEEAIALKPGQSNAYYGLALAYDGLGDTAFALGAMRSYVHLAKTDEPHVRKARAAIWEWESRAGRGGTSAAAAR